jgi:hypothetical protein
MTLDPDFIKDCPYGPGALLIDHIVSIDRDAGSIVARMPTTEELPITRDQRAHPERHPRHVSGGLMIHATGVMGFAHAYFLHGMRHADGWIGYGTHIHDGRFKKLARIGEPIVIACTATSMRKIQGSIFARYKFKFTQGTELVYQGDQSAVWTKIG